MQLSIGELMDLRSAIRIAHLHYVMNKGDVTDDLIKRLMLLSGKLDKELDEITSIVQ